MKTIFIALIWLPITLLAQPFFPDLTGDDLIEAVGDAFYPNSVLSYNQARDTLYGKIDRRNDSLYCVYTGFGVALTPGADPSSDAFTLGLNTEHTWPRSKGAEFGNPLSDMHHLYATREGVNADRASWPFGEISDNATNTWYYLQFETSNIPQASIRDLYSEFRNNARFEPREDHKGNVARAMFYFYTVYRDEADAADPDFFTPQISDLCNWHELDPVDLEELQRSESIATYQDGKVNPFVADCNLLRRTYCPDLPALSCISSTSESLARRSPARVLGVGRRTDRRPYVTLETRSDLRLRVEWYDVLGRSLGSEEKDWYASGTLQLIMTNEVANPSTSGPLVARIQVRDREGHWHLHSVIVP